MSRKILHRGILFLALSVGLTLAAAAPAAAAPGIERGERGAARSAQWLSGVWDWVLWGFGFDVPAAAPDSPAVTSIWMKEGAGYDPNGGTAPQTAVPPPTTDEGAGYDPNGTH